MVFRYLHRPHRTREIASRTHPIPQLVEVIRLRRREKVTTFAEGSQTTPGPARWNSRREEIPTSGPASQGADDDCAADSAPVSLVQVRGSSGPYRPPVVICLIVVFRCIGDK